MKPAEKITDKLIGAHSLETAEYAALIRARDEVRDTLRGAAEKERRRFYGNTVFTRGLIEISSSAKTTAFTAAFADRTLTRSAIA